MVLVFNTYGLNVGVEDELETHRDDLPFVLRVPVSTDLRFDRTLGRLAFDLLDRPLLPISGLFRLHPMSRDPLLVAGSRSLTGSHGLDIFHARPLVDEASMDAICKGRREFVRSPRDGVQEFLPDHDLEAPGSGVIGTSTPTWEGDVVPVVPPLRSPHATEEVLKDGQDFFTGRGPLGEADEAIIRHGDHPSRSQWKNQQECATFS